MSEDMKITVQLFIQTNRGFIQEKTYNTFRIQCVKDKELSDLEVQKMVNLLKEMFSFQGNPQMNIFFQLAPDNIQNYIAQQYKVTSELDALAIDIQKLMAIINYCVEHGFKDPKKEEQKKQEQKKQEIKQQTQEKTKLQVKQVKQQNVQKKQLQPIRKRIIRKISQESQPKQKQKPKKIYIPKPKTPQKKVFIQKHSMPEKVMGPRYLNHISSQPKVKKQEEQNVPVVAPIDLSYIQKHRKMMDSRLQHLFIHYCTQQLSIGKSSTFDHIKDECNKMTLGKFLLFCKTTLVFSDKGISKNFLTSKFKKISQGLKEIDFQKFKVLMEEIDEQYKKKKIKKEGQQIASYEARLMLQSTEFRKMKKAVLLPFTTKQKNGRQFKQFSTISTTVSYNRDLKKQLVSHSGRFPRDLKEDLDIKQLQRQNRKSLPLPRSKIIKLQNIGDYKMGMDHIIQQDETDQYFMKQYKLRDVVGNIKKRVGDFEKMEKKRLI